MDSCTPQKSGGTRTVDLDREAVLAGELLAAREIQMRLVPNTFPPIPGYPEFDLYAALQPAKEVGGDFYDFWMIGKHRLALVMADVSGKGVPAALFMAMTRSYMRAFSHYLHRPGKILTRLNREITRHNSGCMFVTMFCGIVDMSTGVMQYANAGHNPPFMKKRGADADFFPFADLPPIGFLPDLEYPEESIVLDEGETLLFYTDGVTEGMNREGEMVGEERALNYFIEACGTTNMCRDLVERMLGLLGEFKGGAEQYDDIALMAYRHAEQGTRVIEEDEAEEAPDTDEEGYFQDSSLFMSLTDLKVNR